MKKETMNILMIKEKLEESEEIVTMLQEPKEVAEEDREDPQEEMPQLKQSQPRPQQNDHY